MLDALLLLLLLYGGYTTVGGWFRSWLMRGREERAARELGLVPIREIDDKGVAFAGCLKNAFVVVTDQGPTYDLGDPARYVELDHTAIGSMSATQIDNLSKMLSARDVLGDDVVSVRDGTVMWIEDSLSDDRTFQHIRAVMSLLDLFHPVTDAASSG
jgi:hypothetical protein